MKFFFQKKALPAIQDIEDVAQPKIPLQKLSI